MCWPVESDAGDADRTPPTRDARSSSLVSGGRPAERAARDVGDVALNRPDAVWVVRPSVRERRASASSGASSILGDLVDVVDLVDAGELGAVNRRYHRRGGRRTWVLATLTDARHRTGRGSRPAECRSGGQTTRRIWSSKAVTRLTRGNNPSDPPLQSCHPTESVKSAID